MLILKQHRLQLIPVENGVKSLDLYGLYECCLGGGLAGHYSFIHLSISACLEQRLQHSNAR